MSPTGTDLDALAEFVDSAALQVQTRDLAAANEALREIRSRIADVMPTGAEAPRVSVVVPLPDGPLVRFDDLSDNPSARRAIVDLVDEVLVESGLDPGTARLLAVDGIPGLDTCTNAVVARLFPAPHGGAGILAPDWIDLAVEWVFGDQEPDALVTLQVLGVAMSVPVRDAAGILHGCARARAWCDVLTGSVTDRIRTASISFGGAPHVAVAAGGPRVDDKGLLARFHLLTEVAREFHDVTYLCVDIEDSFADLGTGLARATWPDEGGAPANQVAGSVVDHAIPDVYPVQVLGPGHIAALGAPPDGAETIGPDRWLIEIGDARKWMGTAKERAAMVTKGRALLAPLLLAADDLDAEVASHDDEPGTAPAPSDDEHRVTGRIDHPPLPSVVLEPSAHPRRGMHLTVLELAAWLSGEPHSDAPATVSPVLRSYLRELGVGLDDERRQLLRDLAGEAARTGGDPTTVEETRCWILADRLLRVDTPAWLRVAGLTEVADRLARLGPASDDTQLVRGVDLVGHAISTVSSRLDSADALAGDDVDTVQGIAWDVWEEVAQCTGWAAVAGAVTIGVPGDLTFATDQRVMDLSRDPDLRRGVESATRSLGDEIWTTALDEVAGAAWREAWAAADHLVRHESTFSLMTTMRRSFETRLGSSDDPFEILVEEVDVAARQALARLLLVGDTTADFWDRGVASAATVQYGDLWAAALTEARDVLGATLFDDAIAVGRRVLAEQIAEAPRHASRAVVASVTREACSVAGRSVASRAAAVALSGGAGIEEATERARAAVWGVVDDLAADAIALVSRLTTAAG